MQLGFSGHGEPADTRWSSSVCVSVRSFWTVSGASFLHLAGSVSQYAFGKPLVFMSSGRGFIDVLAAPTRIWPGATLVGAKAAVVSPAASGVSPASVTSDTSAGSV